ncbi:TlyA family rRNA (cytidine-2'-O)-methyltransferase [Candidatus Poribacteria bacterium]|nr:MAG: TlyA family rRNA (cytidine-2'-O)-methyltransferase [Candidatus Poribacteria bacterium]
MERLDIVLVQRGFAESRHQAKRLILAGAVRINNNSNLKPGQRIPPDAEIEVEHPPKYVSRGGLKLEKALHVFDITVQNSVAIDVGASTGGFTDCLLQHGADFVYAVDVGYGQLAWKLQKNPRVYVLDKTNIRYIDQHLFSHPLDIAVVDVSFISLRKVLPTIENLGVSDIIALVKPQFEAGRVHVKKGGIVDDPDVHKETLINLIGFVQEDLPAIPAGITFSPIHRDIGNIEYLLWLRKPTAATQLEAGLDALPIVNMDFVNDVVDTAHHAFYADAAENLE